MVLHNFIVFEGIDGSGTSTQMERLKNKIPRNKAFFTAEPTDSAIGKFLRAILKGDVPVQPETAAFLFAADRAEHLYAPGGIITTCTGGKLTVCDRYLFSSLAYQSTACGSDLPYKINALFPLPEYLFFFDIEPSLSLKRISNRNVTEIYEEQTFLEKTAAAYRDIIQNYTQQNIPDMKIITVNAALSVEKVTEKIWSVLRNIPILQE